jgi:hypothetical protein
MAELLRTDDLTQADRFAQWRHWISATSSDSFFVTGAALAVDGGMHI